MSSLRELLEQGLGLLEIGSVKPLGKPGVDLSQQVVRLLPFPLLLPEPAQTHGGPQLQRLCLLPAGDVQGLLQPGLDLRQRCPRLAQEQAPPETIQLLLHHALSRGLRGRQCLVQGRKPASTCPSCA